MKVSRMHAHCCLAVVNVVFLTIVQVFQWLLHLYTEATDVISAQDPSIGSHLYRKRRKLCYINNIWIAACLIQTKSKFHPISLHKKLHLMCPCHVYLIYHLLWEVPLIEVQQTRIQDSCQVGHSQKWTGTQSLIVWEEGVPETLR